MTQLSAHFTLEELTASDTAIRLAIDNTPPPDVVTALGISALGMEAVRAFLGSKPIRVNSGYRCAALNKAIGGAVKSAHMTGYAVDFTCTDFGTPLEIVKALQGSPIQFDQVIQEGTWVHISFDPAMRRQILTAHFDSVGVTYTQGV